MNTLFHPHSQKGIFQTPLFWISHLTLTLILILWFTPITHPYCQTFDIWIFKILNGSLVNHPVWQLFWGILNHRKESLWNILLAVLVNFIIILTTQDKALRKIRIKQIIYFWVCFQIGFMLQDHFFNTFLKVERNSPSLVLPTVLKLSEVLKNPLVKDTSTHSFPGGHAFAMVYWGAFTYLISPKRFGIFCLSFAIFLCLPRLFSGAHWFSDVLFSGILALVWFTWTVYNPIYRNILDFFTPLPKT